MKISHDHAVPLALYTFSMIALLLYLYGFFPAETSYPNSQFQSPNRNCDKECKKEDVLFQKLVLFVIDALRYDFVLPENTAQYMPFTTSSILRNESCLMKLRAQAPTVTLPRLKAMTSGTVPTYFDVIMNFMSSELKQDSFIHHAKSNDLKIVFYGDDTWINLFPDKFIRSEGTNSFFASDYTEVDDNVTRHLDEEFRRNDWDFLILHYLGLDHIGHMEGPKSVLVGPKLKEMDSVILKIFKYLKKMEEDGIRSLFLVTSDHGMKDSGGHGGVTQPEIMLPLVSIGKTCNHIPGWPEDYLAEQIDLAPTISTAFGLPIPNANSGKVMPSLLNGMDLDRLLEVLELNEEALRRRSGFLKNDSASNEGPALPKFTSVGKTSKAVRERVAEYFRDLSRLSDGLRSTTEFNLICLISSVSVMCTVLIVLTSAFIRKLPSPKRATQYFLLGGTLLYGVSLISTSFIEEEHQTWYFLWVTLCILATLETSSLNKLSSVRNVLTVLQWIALLVLHRILRKLNQTGDKWAMLPDLKGYLNSNEHHSLLILVYLSGLLGLFLCALCNGCTGRRLVTFVAALLMNLSYRLSISSIRLDFLSFYPKSRGKLDCTVFWLLTALFAMQRDRNKRSDYLVWSLIASILLKPHNVVILPVQIAASRLINKLYYKTDDILWNSIAHYWMGYVFYFYQGNGNSLANVDVSAGFVGLEEYNPVYSCLQIAAHTNSGHVLSFLLSPRSNLTLSVLRLIPLTIYCTSLIFQLNHLFIWSVFSPKLLYETNFSAVSLFLLCFNCFYTSS